MFWKKKPSSNASATPLPFYPAEPPRPILKTSPSPSSPTSIRFAQNGASQPEKYVQPAQHGSMCSQTPSIIVTSQPGAVVILAPAARPYSTVTGPASTTPIAHGVPPALQHMGSIRRSSRPTSPSASSFGARIRTSQCSISSTATMTPISPLPAAPLTGTHITTPPTAYVSTFQERAPPPPSPYRPTSERARTSTSFARPLPELQLLSESDAASRPSCNSSLFAISDSIASLPDTLVPMLNIIPATPQHPSDEFNSDALVPSPRRKVLEEAVRIEEMEDIPLDLPVMPAAAASSRTTGLPSIDVDLDFSPFSPLADLPDMEERGSGSSQQQEYGYSYGFNCEAQSPPFESFPSLPSLSSQASLPSSASETSMPNSSSTDSLASFPDVEEALGSMLASLSNNDFADLRDTTSKQSKRDTVHAQYSSGNAGLGLGLDLPETVAMSSSSSTTAPLSPARRRKAPPPLDLRFSKGYNNDKPALASAPPCTNHRVAFYRTAKAAPNSPTSGIFTIDLGLSDHSPLSSLDLNHWMGGESYTASGRDSLSLESEASDDDLHTASIISLTPVLGDRARMVEVREELLPGSLSVVGEVGLAL